MSNLKSYVIHTIGGGWGKETIEENLIKVSVIRGTDFPKLEKLDFSSVPIRFETLKKIESRTLQVGDLIIEVSGGSASSGQRTGRCLYITQEILDNLGKYVIPASFCRLLRLDKEKINSKFIYYQIAEMHLSDQIGIYENQSTGISNFQFNLFLDEIFPKITDLNKQNSIVDIFNSIDQKIQVNTKINQTLEQIAQALFKSWFVDFDPVRAKVQALSDGLSLEQAELAAMQAISGKTPEELTALSQTQPDRYAELAETAKAFPCEFGGDGVPMGWNISIIGQEVETVGGATPSTKEEKFWNNGEIAWTTPKDLSSATSPVLLKTERKITESGLKKISSGLLSIGTVLLSSRAPVGYLSLAQIPVAINQGYIAIKCNKSLNNYYMLQWCKENLEEIKGRASGTTFLEISKTTFRQIPIIVPDGNILSLFEKQCSSIYQSITVNTKENIYLEKTRDLLLPRLLNGEI